MLWISLGRCSSHRVPGLEGFSLVRTPKGQGKVHGTSPARLPAVWPLPLPDCPVVVVPSGGRSLADPRTRVPLSAADSTSRPARRGTWTRPCRCGFSWAGLAVTPATSSAPSWPTSCPCRWAGPGQGGLPRLALAEALGPPAGEAGAQDPDLLFHRVRAPRGGESPVTCQAV